MEEKSIEQHKVVTLLLEALRDTENLLMRIEDEDNRGTISSIDYAIYEVGAKAPKLMEVAEALAYASHCEAKGYSAGWKAGHGRVVSAVLKQCDTLLEEACDEKVVHP